MESAKTANYKSCFDIIGPIMVGPSSSHTAGAIVIGQLARQLFGKTPKSVRCVYYESFAETHKGHGTDFAIISGVLGFATNDDRVPYAASIAEEMGVHIEFIERQEPSPVMHANTADLTLSDEERQIRLIGTSIGGGAVEVKYIEVDGFSMELTGPLPIVLEMKSLFAASQVLPLLKAYELSIVQERIVRVGTQELIAYELGDLIGPNLLEELKAMQHKSPIYLFT